MEEKIKAHNEFYFSESTLQKEIERLERLILECGKQQIHIQMLNWLPPCIDMRIRKKFPDFKSNLKKAIIIDKNHALISHNLAYMGKNSDWIKGTQSKLKNIVQIPKYTFEKCIQCRAYKEKKCKGIPNKYFENEKETLKCKMGHEKYNRVKEDYTEGCIVHGSACRAKCLFCFERNVPDSLLLNCEKLSVNEIGHFLNYIAYPVEFVGVNTYCKSGDFFAEEDYKDILGAIFSYTEIKNIITNPIHLTREKIIEAKRRNINLVLSATTLNSSTMKKLSRPELNTDIKEVLRAITEEGASAEISLVPFKSLIENNEIEESAKFIAENTSIKDVTLHFPTFSRYTDKTILKECNIEFEKISKEVERIRAKYPMLNIVFSHGYSDTDRIRERVKQRLAGIKKICSHKSIAIISSKTVEKPISLACSELGFDKFYVRSIAPRVYGGNVAASGFITFEEYLEEGRNLAECNEFDALVIGRDSFNTHLKDMRLKSINNLYEELNMRIIII